MNGTKGKLFMIMTLVLCLILFLKRMTGEIWHAILGILLSILLMVHMCRKKNKLKYMNTSVQLVDWILLADLAVVFLSGMLLHPLQGVATIKILHKISSVLLLIGVIVHVVQHKKK